MDWTYGFSSQLSNGVVNLTRPDDPERKRVCYAAGHTLVIYDHETASQTHLQGHRNPISCVVATEDRALVATADTGADAMIVLWDVDTGEPVRTLPSPHANGVAAMDLTAGGDFCVTVGAIEDPGETQEVHVWDLGDEDACEPVLSGSIPAGDVQTCVRFHPNAPTEFVTNGASRVFFWSSESKATAELRYYSPPVSAKDFKQPIGAFTVSCFLVSSHKDVAGQGRCVTGTADGDLVVFDSGGVPPGGADRLERRGMRPGDRRAVKIIRVHHAAVTHLGTTGGARYGAGRPQLVSGGSEGNVRFFDQKLRLVAWFDGLEQGAVTSVAFVAQKGLHEKYRASFDDVDEEDEVEIPGQTLLMGAFDAPDFVVGTDHSTIYAFSSATFEESGSAEAVRTAEELVRGTYDAVVDMTSHPTEPLLFCLGGGGVAWTWDYEGKFVVTKADLADKGKGPKPTAACYRCDGRGILVGTSNGALKALDPRTLADVQTMRFGKDAVTMLAMAEDDEYAAAADAAGCVAIFKLHGPIVQPESEEDEPERAFDFIGKYRAHSARSPVRGLAFKSRPGGGLELVSVGAEGRVVRYDVFNSTEEGGVKLIDVRDDAIGGPAAGGVASPTALAFMPDPRRPDALALLVADDQYKIRTVDVDTLTTTRTVLGPTFGGPVTRIVPFNAGGDACAPHAAYATARKVCGVAAMPLDGDPARAMGVVAHPAEVGAVCVARDDVAVFTVGSHASTNEGSAGRVINVWNVGKEAVDAQRVGSTAAERVAEQLLEGGAEGEFYGEVKDYFLYSQLRAQGEDSTADRLAGIDKPVPTSEIPRLLRALGHYPSERELSDIFRELAVETSGDGDMAADPPATIGFDRFVSLYVNYRPMFGVDAGAIESAFAALGAGAGESVERGSLLETLELGGEAMSREELVAAAAKLMGRGATLEDLVPETVSAREFAEDVLGFVGAAEEIPVDA